MPRVRIAKSIGVMPEMLHKVGWLEVTGNLNFNFDQNIQAKADSGVQGRLE